MMGELPNSWMTTSLGEFCEVILGQSPKSEFYNKGGNGLPFFQGKAEFGEMFPEVRVWCTNPSKICEANDTLISVRAPVGPTNLAPSQSCIGRGLAALRSQAGTDPKYVLYAMRAMEPQVSQMGTGSTFAAISGSVLRALEVPVAPLNEQRRIVDEIEKQFTRLDAAVDALRRVQGNLKRYRASVLKAACEGRLVPTEAALARAEGRSYESADVLLQRILKERRKKWEEDQLAKFEAKGKLPKDDAWKKKYQEPAAPEVSDLPQLPEGWCWASFPMLGTLDRGKSRHRPRNAPHLYGGPYPFIQTGEIRHADTFVDEFEKTYSEAGLAQSRLWPKGTLCITIAANIAETAILNFDACFPDSVVGFVGSSQLVSTRYVELFIRTIRDEIDRYAPATAQKNINLEILRDVAIALPPIAEQCRIVDEIDRRLSVVGKADHDLNEQLTRAERLRQAILKRAFEGRLVPQDPSDEPAGVLLERIRAEREARAAAGKKRKTVTKAAKRKTAAKRKSRKAGD